MKPTRRHSLTIVASIAILFSLFSLVFTPRTDADGYHSIGGGSPGFVRYAIRGGSCGCGVWPDGRPMCDMTGPISY